ncbi:MAG: DnaJ domain-containing protein [Myxococcaceae bacterium]
MSTPPTQVFVRNAEGKIWGPIAASSVKMLLEDGHLTPPLQVSRDGIAFGPPDTLPDFAEVVPRELWAGRARPKTQHSPPVLTPVDATATAKSKAPSSDASKRSVSIPDGIPAEGELAKVSVARLYALAATRDATGLFSFEMGGRVLWVHFKKGAPERVESSHPDDSVGAFLVQQGLLSKDALARAEKEKAKFGGEVIGALMGLGLANPNHAFAALGQRASTLLARALSTGEGHFSFSAQELPPHQALPLGQRWAILSDAMRKTPTADVLRRLSDERALPVMKSGCIVPVSELRLTPQEARAYTFIDGVRSLDELMRDFPAEADIYARLVFLLRELEGVSFAAVRPRMPPPPPESPSPASAPSSKPTTTAAPPAPDVHSHAPPATSPSPATRPVAGPKPQATSKPVVASVPVDPAAELAKLREQIPNLKGQNHFQILSVPESADDNTVKIAYFKLAKLYHPDTVPTDAPPELGKLKAEMFAAIGEAYQVLGEGASRQQYLSDLKTGGTEKVDVAQILAAEDIFQKGTLLVKGRRYAEALEHFKKAIEGNPEEGEFYAWRGYTHFLLSTDKEKGTGDAIVDLEEALRKNPRCAPAHYFNGLIAKANGELAAAKQHFLQTVDIAPGHVDAQRELRLMNSGKK